jgi:hypothetical protein
MPILVIGVESAQGHTRYCAVGQWKSPAANSSGDRLLYTLRVLGFTCHYTLSAGADLQRVKRLAGGCAQELNVARG